MLKPIKVSKIRLVSRRTGTFNLCFWQYNSSNFRFNKGGKKIDKKMKAAAPTAEDLDNELMKYMGADYQVKKLESELDSYFQKGDQQDSA